MPFAAICKKCQHFLIGKDLPNIQIELIDHFNNYHKSTPISQPYAVQYPDDFNKKKVIRITTIEMYPFRERSSSFMTRLFISDLYEIALITNYYYDDCNRKFSSSEEKQKYFSSRLAVYFE